MNIQSDKPKRILVITLSNIGDVILTTPVIYAINRQFPEARLDVMASAQGVEIFEDDPKIFKVIPYNKHGSFMEKFRLIKKLRGTGYDMVVDLRNTLMPFFLSARYKTSLFKTRCGYLRHKKDAHLYRIKKLGINIDGAKMYLDIPSKDVEYVDRLLGKYDPGKCMIAISPGAKSLIKRWTIESLARVCDKLITECALQLVMVGDKTDRKIIDEMLAKMKGKPANLAGYTSIKQLGEILRRCSMLIANDSAPMHVASAVGTKVLAIFGPTSTAKYGPSGKDDVVVKASLKCMPCEVAQCRFGTNACMKSISEGEVFEVAKRMLQK